MVKNRDDDNELPAFLREHKNKRLNEIAADKEKKPLMLPKPIAKQKPDMIIETSDGKISLVEFKENIKAELYEELRRGILEDIQSIEPKDNDHNEVLGVASRLFAGAGVFYGGGKAQPINYGDIDYDNYRLKCKVKSILEQEGKSQKWLSQQSKIHQSTLSGILNNTSATSLEYAFRISRAMGRSIEELFEYYDYFNSDEE